MSVHFEQETAVEPLGDGRYGVTFSRDWYVHAGPNGGIVAAVLLRACTAAVGDPNRSPRTLTVHYLGPPAEGPAEVHVRIERAGKGISFVSARLEQGGEAKALALVAYGTPRAEKVAWSARPLPVMAPPEHCPVLHHALEEPPNIHHRWETRLAIGTPNPAGPTEAAVSGGWIRASVPTPVDHVLVAALADAWLPPVLARPGIPLLSVPTVELTVHFRDTTTLPQIGAGDWFACSFRTDVAQEGFLEEDGLIWAADGRLVAMSRQLAVVVERRSFP
ncbi:MAG: acyl-CoA thioesterase [Acidimicrobiia bacterium]